MNHFWHSMKYRYGATNATELKKIQQEVGGIFIWYSTLKEAKDIDKALSKLSHLEKKGGYGGSRWLIIDNTNYILNVVKKRNVNKIEITLSKGTKVLITEKNLIKKYNTINKKELLNKEW